MLDTEKRLIQCFQAVFPELSETEAALANSSSVTAWDSVATVTLVAAVEEEFDVYFPPADIEKMNSFESYLRLLGSR